MRTKRIVALFLMMILITVSSVSMASTVMLRANGKNSVTVSISASGGYITASARATINVGSNPSVVVVVGVTVVSPILYVTALGAAIA